MATLTFDTMKLVDALEKVQIPREQARAIVDVVRDSHEAADVATKGDIALIRKDMDLVRKDMEALENRLLLKLGGMLIAGFATVIAILVRLLG